MISNYIIIFLLGYGTAAAIFVPEWVGLKRDQRDLEKWGESHHEDSNIKESWRN